MYKPIYLRPFLSIISWMMVSICSAEKTAATERSLSASNEDLSLPRLYEAYPFTPTYSPADSDEELALSTPASPSSHPVLKNNTFNIEQIPGYATSGAWHSDITGYLSFQDLMRYRTISKISRFFGDNELRKRYIYTSLPIVFDFLQFNEAAAIGLNHLALLNSLNTRLDGPFFNLKLLNFKLNGLINFGENGEEWSSKLLPNLFKNVRSLRIIADNLCNEHWCEVFAGTGLENIKKISLENCNGFKAKKDVQVAQNKAARFKNFLDLLRDVETFKFSTEKGFFFLNEENMKAFATSEIAKKIKDFQFTGPVSHAASMINALNQYAQNFNVLKKIKITKIGHSTRALPVIDPTLFTVTPTVTMEVPEPIKWQGNRTPRKKALNPLNPRNIFAEGLLNDGVNDGDHVVNIANEPAADTSTENLSAKTPTQDKKGKRKNPETSHSQSGSSSKKPKRLFD